MGPGPFALNLKKKESRGVSVGILFGEVGIFCVARKTGGSFGL
jgi:hypothetical protein